MQTIAVMAGTIVDTQMGVTLLQDKGYKARGYPISKNYYEQDRLQFLSRDELECIAIEKLRNMRNEGIESCLLYCNSLSAALDYTRLAKNLNMRIITPFHAYTLLANEYEFFYIVAANSLAAKNIEEHIKRINRHAHFLSLGFLSFVKEIESNTSKEMILQHVGLQEMLAFFERVEPQIQKKAILLSCTHFPFMLDIMQAQTNITIINPADILIKLIKTDL